MSKYYIASPFFCEFDKIIKKDMIEKLGTDDYFDPASTENSKSYSNSPGNELAKSIFNENVENIKNCDILVFPMYTNDLGTLMEIGIATKLGKTIQRYNYLDGTLSTVVITDSSSLHISKDGLVKLDNLGQAILLGYNYDTPHNIYYDVGDLNDNIMLSIPFTRVGLDSTKKSYKVIDIDYKEVS